MTYERCHAYKSSVVRFNTCASRVFGVTCNGNVVDGNNNVRLYTFFSFSFPPLPLLALLPVVAVVVLVDNPMSIYW
jgi:hypothetical protein